MREHSSRVLLCWWRYCCPCCCHKHYHSRHCFLLLSFIFQTKSVFKVHFLFKFYGCNLEWNGTLPLNDNHCSMRMKMSFPIFDNGEKERWRDKLFCNFYHWSSCSMDAFAHSNSCKCVSFVLMKRKL